MSYYNSGYLITDTKSSDGEATEITTDASIAVDTSIDVTIKQDESGGTSADNQETISINTGTNTNSLSNFSSVAGSSYWAKIDLSTNDDSSTPSLDSITISTTNTPASPNNVSATVDANDQITLTWDADTSDGPINDYQIEVSRDSSTYTSPSGGANTVSHDGSSSYTETYGPNSDNSYGSQVGIDSSFDFRVLATNSAGDSSWSYSSTVYTDPIPPHNPSVSRPDANTIDISWENKSDSATIDAEVSMREDTGSGYGSWKKLDNYSGTSASLNVGDSSQYTNLEISEDARYQIRLRNFNTDASSTLSSKYVYADYGNSGNVYFEDDFEDQDLAEWNATLSDADSGITSGSNTSLGISGADDGTYYCRLDGTDELKEYFGDLSAETDVIVKAVIATGSIDSTTDNPKIQWYDGSSWQTLTGFNWEYNRQGWTEVTALVPDSYLTSESYVRFTGTGGSDDHFAVDRVVVSDILHEYTKPAAPTNLSLDVGVQKEITVNWTDNANFNYKQEVFYSDDGGSSYSSETYWSTSGESYTLTGLNDGEQYTCWVRAVVRQFRHGSVSQWFYPDSATVADTTILPAPSQLSTTSIGGDDVDISWVNHHNNGTLKVQYKKSSNTTWNDFSTGLGTTVNSETITGLSYDTQYDARIVLSTEHKNHEDVVVSNNEKITVQSPYVVDSKDVVRGNLTIQE